MYVPYICWMPLRSSSGSTKFGWMPWYHGNIKAPFTELCCSPSECPNSWAATAKSEVPEIHKIRTFKVFFYHLNIFIFHPNNEMNDYPNFENFAEQSSTNSIHMALFK